MTQSAVNTGATCYDVCQRGSETASHRLATPHISHHNRTEYQPDTVKPSILAALNFRGLIHYIVLAPLSPVSTTRADGPS